MQPEDPQIELLDSEAVLPIDVESSMRIEDLLQRYDQILSEMDALNQTIEGILSEINAIQPSPASPVPPNGAN